MSGKKKSKDITPEDAVSLQEEPKHDIPEDKIRAAGGRGVGRLRRCNIRMLIASVIILMVLCGVLLVRIRALNGKVADMTAQLARLAGIATQQQEQLMLLFRHILNQKCPERNRQIKHQKTSRKTVRDICNRKKQLCK